jgi:hypothetical protein
MTALWIGLGCAGVLAYLAILFACLAAGSRADDRIGKAADAAAVEALMAAAKTQQKIH